MRATRREGTAVPDRPRAVARRRSARGRAAAAAATWRPRRWRSSTCPTRSSSPTTGWCCDTRLTGICGSDSKQVLMDFERRRRQHDDGVHLVPPGARPRGGRTVSTRSGRRSGTSSVGQRVVLNPNLGCRPRGISAAVPGVRARRLLDLLATSTRAGSRPASTPATRSRPPAGSPSTCRAHESMAFAGARRDRRRGRRAGRSVVGVVPRHHPQPAAAGGRVVVYGAGALGTTSTAILTPALPDRRRRRRRPLAGAGRPGPAAGRRRCSHPSRREALVEALADWSGATLRALGRTAGRLSGPRSTSSTTRSAHRDGRGRPAGAAPTAARSCRWVSARRPASSGRRGTSRSCASSARTRSATRRSRASGSTPSSTTSTCCVDGRIDLTGMLTHQFRLDEWREAFTTIVDQGDTGAIKVAFDQRRP